MINYTSRKAHYDVENVQKTKECKIHKKQFLFKQRFSKLDFHHQAVSGCKEQCRNGNGCYLNRDLNLGFTNFEKLA